MRTKTISRWRKAALATVTAASLALPIRAQQAPATAQPAPGENGQIPAADNGNAANTDAGATQEYTIQRGDTLWDLSQKFLANPWYWPKIWSLNPSIENPHWIYPGQKLTIKPGVAGAPSQVDAPAGAPGSTEQASAEVGAQGGAAGTEAGAGENAPADLGVAPSVSDAALAAQVVTSAGRLAFKPPPVVRVMAPGIVGQQEIDQAGTLDSSFEEKGMIAPFDTAYVRFKQDNAARVGDKLTIFRLDGEINTATGEKLATRTRSVGEAKVIAVSGQVLTVQITSEREEVERGDLVRPWADDARRLAPKPNAKEVNGSILSSVDATVEQIGIGQQVFIDKGKNDGVEDGNTFLVLHRGDGLGTTGSGMLSYTEGDMESTSERGSDPDENVGMLMVIDARDNISTAVVVRSVRELEVGDRIQMRAGSGG